MHSPLVCGTPFRVRYNKSGNVNYLAVDRFSQINVSVKIRSVTLRTAVCACKLLF